MSRVRCRGETESSVPLSEASRKCNEGGAYEYEAFRRSQSGILKTSLGLKSDCLCGSECLARRGCEGADTIYAAARA
jgi:hypothetical protein